MCAQAGQFEEANWQRARTGAPPYALDQAEIYIRLFRRKGFQGAAAASALLLWMEFLRRRTHQTTTSYAPH